MEQLSLALVKGIIMTAVIAVLAANEPFWHQLLLVLVSSGLTAAALIYQAYTTMRETKRANQRIEETYKHVQDIARMSGVTKREDDIK